MSQEIDETVIDVETNEKMTDQLMETFKVFLHAFMAGEKISNFGPTNHLQRFEPETGIHVSYIMRSDSKIQMTTTVPFETLTKYLSFFAPEAANEEPTDDAA